MHFMGVMVCLRSHYVETAGLDMHEGRALGPQM